MKYLLLIVSTILVVWTMLAVALIPKAASEGKVPLVWTTDPNPQREPQVDWFNKMYPDCKLRIDPDNQDRMKVIVQSSAGMGPDIIGHITNQTLQTYLEAGIVWDVTEQAKKMGFSVDTLPETVRPLVQLRDPNTLELRQYTYPCNVFHTFIIYNKDLFDEAGVSYPSTDLTWEEYIDKAQKLTRYSDGEKNIPEVFGAGDAKPQILIWEKGGSMLNADGTRCTLGEPEAVAGMAFYHDLFFKYHVEPSPVQEASVTSQGGWGGGSYRNWFGERKIAMIFGARWMLIQFRRFFSQQLEQQREWEQEHPGEDYPGPTPFRMGACLVPRFKDGNRYTTSNARCAGINKMSPHREDALKFLQYLAGEKYSELINTGADSKPGNKKYISLERFVHPDWPGEQPVHRMSIESIPYGRSAQPSLFVNQTKVRRIFTQARDYLEANPDLTYRQVEDVMKNAARRIDTEIATNIKRTPHLRRAYDDLLAQGAEPVAIDLDTID